MLEKLLYANRILNTKRLVLPDFLGIGAQKSGTTWLYENLREHPDLFLTDQKEIEYFDNNFDLDLRWYSNKFLGGIGKVKGEISPSYCYLPEKRIRFIRIILPNVRLIFLMRNPIDRTWSHAFMSIVTRTGRTLEQIPDAEFLEYFRKPWVMQASNYPAMLDHWLGVFPRDQLFLGLYDAIKSDPQGLLREIFEFLGVSQNVDWNKFPYGQVIIPPTGAAYAHRDPGRGIRVQGHQFSDTMMPDRFREFLLSRYREQINILHLRFGLATQCWFAREGGRDVTQVAATS